MSSVDEIMRHYDLKLVDRLKLENHSRFNYKQELDDLPENKLMELLNQYLNEKR